MRREVSEGVIMAVAYCRPTSRGEGVDGGCFKQVMEVSVSQMLVVRGEFKLSDICWKANSQTDFWRVSGITVQGKNFFTLRTVNYWNRLTGEMV